MSRPDQIDRSRRLGAVVSGNPYYPLVLADNYRVNGLDPERADPMVRMGDVERAGISYSFHSDMPMAPGQPLYLMWTGVNRIILDGNLRAPEQRVSRLGALKAVTVDAAYSLGLDDRVGSIEPEPGAVGPRGWGWYPQPKQAGRRGIRPPAVTRRPVRRPAT